MKFNLSVEPETDEEMALIEMLYQAREFAEDQTDIDHDKISVMFTYMGSAMSEDMDEVKEFDCPQCGEPVLDLNAQGLGDSPTARPCACELNWEEVPQAWFT